MNKAIYLDFQSTTPADERVVEAMIPYFSERFANAASSHRAGEQAAAAVEASRRAVAALIGAEPSEILFVSGATEANNLALKGVFPSPAGRDQIVTFATEHHAVLDAASALQSAEIRVDVLPVLTSGQPDLKALESCVSDSTAVASVAFANNEIGSVAPLAEIAEIVHRSGALFHSDAAQAVGHLPVDVRALDIDLLSLSAHKFYGPKGIGALYVRRELRDRLSAQMHGGGQERGLRSGTSNVPAIVGFGKASELAVAAQASDAEHASRLRDRLLGRLASGIDDMAVNGALEHRLPGNLNVRVPGVDSEALIASCHDVCFSSGSACASATPAPSHVLLAIGCSHDAAEESVRFSVGRSTTIEDVDNAAHEIIGAVDRIRKAMNGSLAA